MVLVVNELSLHEQFNDVKEFSKALLLLMNLRNTAIHFNRDIFHNGKLYAGNPTPNLNLYEAISKLDRNQQRAFSSWLSKKALWDNDFGQPHPDTEWFESCGDIVTDTALGEVGYRKIQGENWALVSFSPSDWNYSPIRVTWKISDGEIGRNVEVPNFWENDTIRKKLEKLELPLSSWSELRKSSIRKFTKLSFTEKCFEDLEQIPFNSSTAIGLEKRFRILNELIIETDKTGRRSQRGHELYNNFFTGDRGYFSDSSDDEKRDFKNELTFSHPDISGESIFCPWHGKIRTSYIRIRFHFSSIKGGEPCYIVYVGQKLTKK